MSRHVVIDALRQTMRCNHCRDEQALPTPCPVTEMVRQIDTFEKAHQDCPANTGVSKPLRVRTGPDGAALVRDSEGMWWTWIPTHRRGTYSVSALTRADALEGLSSLIDRHRTSTDLDDQATVRQAQLALADEGVKP